MADIHINMFFQLKKLTQYASMTFILIFLVT